MYSELDSPGTRRLRAVGMCMSASGVAEMDKRVVAVVDVAAAAEIAAAGSDKAAAENGVGTSIDYESRPDWPRDSNPIWLKSLAM